MGIKPSMTFLLIKGLRACYLEGTSHPELYLHIRVIRPVFLAEFETARNEPAEVLFRSWSGTQAVLLLHSAVIFHHRWPSLQNLGVSVLLFRNCKQAGDRNGDIAEELGRKFTLGGLGNGAEPLGYQSQLTQVCLSPPPHPKPQLCWPGLGHSLFKQSQSGSKVYPFLAVRGNKHTSGSFPV